MTLKVTATQGGSTANGMLLRVMVLTGAAARQTGATATVLKAASNTFTTSITTTQTGSRVYGAIEIQASTTNVSATAASTLIDDVNDATNSDHYTTFKATSLTGTPGATTLGATNTSPSAVAPIVMLEVLTAGGLTEDASGPAVVSTTSATTVTTANFSPPPGSLLVALVASDGGASTTTMTVSGGNLIWTEKVKQNTAGNDYAGIWIAQVPLANRWTAPVRAPQVSPLQGGRVSRSSTPAVTAPPPPPVTGPVFYPAQMAIRAKYPHPYPVAGAVRGSGTGGAVAGAVSGAGFGSATGSAGAPVRNPVQGPVFRQAVKPVRFILPPWQPRAGRIGSSFGAPVINPHRGPPAYPLEGPVRARPPQLQPRAGRTNANAGAPVRNPVAGPVFTSKPYPVKARNPLPRHGRVTSNPGAPVSNPAPSGTGPAFYPRNFASARQPLSRRGTVRAIRFYPLPANPVAGPVFTQGTSPVRSHPALPPRGRISASPGAPAQQAPPPAGGPPVPPWHGPVRARIPQVFARGRVSSAPGGPVQNPEPPPSVPRTGATPGAIRAASPLVLRGRISLRGAGAPVVIPTRGPAFRQAASPVRIHPVLPPRGRVGGNPGGPVLNPAPGTTGPVFRPRNFARAQLPLPRRGTCRAIRFYPVSANPAQGPVFRQATEALRARLPFPPPRGRVASSATSPAVPVPNVVQVTGAMPWAVRAALPVVLRGRVTSFPRAAAAVTPPPTSGPAFRQAVQPARIRPAPPPRGRVASNPGGPVRNPVPGITGPPFYPFRSPVRVHPVLPPRGRTSGNPGIPVAVPVRAAPVYPLHGPVAARRPLPPHGRVITGNPGAPVRNPQHGQPFHSLPWPARTRIPQNAPRGRTSSNPGGPVANIPVATLLFRLGSPYFQWETDTPGLTSEWSTGTPVFAWTAGVPETSA